MVYSFEFHRRENSFLHQSLGIPFASMVSMNSCRHRVARAMGMRGVDALRRTAPARTRGGCFVVVGSMGRAIVAAVVTVVWFAGS